MITHKGTNPIETIRLQLRRFEYTDVEDMYNNWASDPEVVKYLPWGPHESIKVTRKRISDWILNYSYDNNYNWAICFKRNNEVIGSISAEILNDRDGICEVGYCIGRKYWGQGIMTEALRAVMHYLFYEVGYQKITARHDILNPASGKVMQKTGMQFERMLYQVSKRRDGSLCDCAVYGKVRGEI
ncbi:MAG TPA: GNAT family N-acetyltransferase [Mobilitalea sp.]|nr:GNAT family N-acetyltransferase [Mobilitalea sp.]